MKNERLVLYLSTDIVFIPYQHGNVVVRLYWSKSWKHREARGGHWNSNSQQRNGLEFIRFGSGFLAVHGETGLWTNEQKISKPMCKKIDS